MLVGGPAEEADVDKDPGLENGVGGGALGSFAIADENEKDCCWETERDEGAYALFIFQPSTNELALSG